MTIFSIDLGIDPAATQGNDGTEAKPYPMQISLSKGDLEGVRDEDRKFVPDALSSWFMFRSSANEEKADRLMVRIFDLGDPADALKSKFNLKLRLHLSNLDGTRATQWKPANATACIHCGDQKSLGYQKPGQDHYPCYKVMDDLSLLHYPLTIEPTSLAGSNKNRFLLTAWVEATPLEATVPNTEPPIFFLSDPEVIVSPYGDGDGSGMAATSR